MGPAMAMPKLDPGPEDHASPPMSMEMTKMIRPTSIADLPIEAPRMMK